MSRCRLLFLHIRILSILCNLTPVALVQVAKLHHHHHHHLPPALSCVPALSVCLQCVCRPPPSRLFVSVCQATPHTHTHTHTHTQRSPALPSPSAPPVPVQAHTHTNTHGANTKNNPFGPLPARRNVPGWPARVPYSPSFSLVYLSTCRRGSMVNRWFGP
ncbi:hypothetical protein IWZ03DRAFT_126982 [Phyllosticta citriasiana]|uniref:Secreted protein n=1 Tax=Phyllosticta citriasiana TaxID=595635 RepID=A0ABR1KR31_9PEZI